MVDTLTPMKFINDIVEALFHHEDKRLESVIVRLNARNNEVRGDQHDGFLFNGLYFRPSHLIKGKSVKVGLDDSLGEEMRAHLMDRARIDNDKALIKQTLFLLLHPCNTLQDMRDALPEVLVDFIPDFKQMPRSAGRDAGWSLTNPRHQKQYQMILDKIEFYWATRLLY